MSRLRILVAIVPAMVLLSTSAYRPELSAPGPVRPAPISPITRDSFTLRLKQSFGSSPTEEGKDSLPLGGGTLAQIAGIRRLDNGRVAVLDAAFKKVVIFDSRSRAQRIIGLGHGRGPGEFILPTSLAVWRDSVAVFDYSQSRVSVFDTAGTLLTTMTTRRAKDVILFRGNLWGSQMPGRSHILWRLPVGADVAATRDELPLDPGHARWTPRGVIARMGEDYNGGVIIGHQRPGLWFQIAGNGTVQGPFGAELFPGQSYFAPEGIPVPPAETNGIVGLSSELIAIMFTRFINQGRGRPPNVEPRRLAIYNRRTGRPLGMVPFGGLSTPVTAIAPGPSPGEIYFAAYEPYPRVVLAEVVRVDR